MGDSMASTSSVLDPLSFTSSHTVPVQPSNPASPVEGAKYDVFLNFRGPDTKQKFTNHLYHDLLLYGLDTIFKDEPELQIGEEISVGLADAIEDSKTYVVVFSKDYATSPWCLDELAQIYERYEQKKILVIGVYYGIEPNVVRHQLESFKVSFDKHQTGRSEGEPARVEPARVKEWRCALTGVANFSGLTISGKNGVEVDNVTIIKEIARVIWQHVKPKKLHVADHFVDREILEEIKNRITPSLRSETVKDVIKIGLHGFGGVGKTTLAKDLYNHLLESIDVKTTCCFLADVRETFGNPNKGLVSLQNQLISAFFKSTTIDNKVHNEAQGTEFIKTRFGKTKVLLLIDDVDEFQQCKSLMGPYAPGSVVIITTRNTLTLDDIKVEPTHRFEIKVMKHAESLALFTAHAFPNAEPDKSLMDMFGNDILCLADNLPLALTVFGSHLSNKCKAEWKDYTNKLQKLDPKSTIRDRLMISLDSMEDLTLKNIFIDIACFFVGRKTNYVVHIMEKYYSLDVLHNIRTLQKRSLLTIDLNDKLEMHDLLRDMGWEAARNKFPCDELENHTRLWVLDDICDVLEKERGGKAIEGIIPSNFNYGNALKDLKIRTKTFKKMRNLRFLYIKDVELTGSFQQIFGSLKWLWWECCPLPELPSHFQPRKLVVLELLRSKIVKWEVTRVFEYLKTLDMSNSIDLTTLPDFSKLPNLITLNLEGCERLTMFAILDGCLKKLVSLNLGRCVNLGSIYDRHCSLKALEVLVVSECEKLDSLPDNLWEIASFRELELFRGSRSLRSPFKDLELWNIPLTTLPSIINQLLKVERVDIRDSPNLVSLEYLPPNIKNLFVYDCEALRQVILSNLTKLQEISLVPCLSVTEIVGLEGLTSLKLLRCNASVVGYTLVRSLLKMPSQNVKIIHPWGIPDWIPSCDNMVGHTSVHQKHWRRSIIDYYKMDDRFIAPDVQHNFLGIMLLLDFIDHDDFETEHPWYEVHNYTNGESYSQDAIKYRSNIVMIILPSSFVSVNGGDKIIVRSDGKLHGFVLVYDD